MSEFNSAFYKNFYSETLFVTRDANANVPLPEEELIVTGPEITYNEKVFKGLVILVSEKNETFSQILQNEFLTKILKAIKFEMHDVAFVNIALGGKINLAVLGKKLPVKSVVSFGTDLLDIDKIPAPYKHFHVGPTPVLLSESLTQLEADQSKKRLLWNGLQGMFL
ncbi:hypothetical protein I5M27_07965 [Adhaeribacter sp. BT258]|uniref:Uncharacterized protein n=1 Tax=Adhaeribacter terrigena TaxID=2793070 RepID=A0ABS1C0I3_9BACT|nr:hypothetical protein [Adhaeribacter terrigena]MBK0402919.1 hypothetical protein [Adhaeribacter terrigena]